MNIAPSLLKALGRDGDFLSHLVAQIGEGRTAKTLGVSDVHVSTALGNGKKKQPAAVDFNTALDGGVTIDNDVDKLLFDEVSDAAVTEASGGSTFAEMLAKVNNVDLSKVERALKPHKDGGAHTPFPYDPQAMDKIPQAQQRRFLSALTNQDDLPQRSVPIKSLVAMQPRVSPDKVNSIRENGADKLPLVVRHDSKNYVADGNHRATASWLDGENMIDCKFCRLSGEDESLSKEVDWKLDFEIRKSDEDEQLIFGWASIVQKGDYLIIDKQGDAILPDELERAAYDYMLEARDHGDTHKIIGTGKCIESCVFTLEKQKALGIVVKGEDGQQIVGWWVGYKVGDDVWARHKSGELKEFSIGGRSASVPIDDIVFDTV